MRSGKPGMNLPSRAMCAPPPMGAVSMIGSPGIL